MRNESRACAEATTEHEEHAPCAEIVRPHRLVHFNIIIVIPLGVVPQRRLQRRWSSDRFCGIVVRARLVAAAYTANGKLPSTVERGLKEHLTVEDGKVEQQVTRI